MKTLAIATAAIGLVFTAAPALADQGEYRTMDVSVAGLDLDTPEGQALLDQRVQRAAREVCGYNEQRVGTRIRDNGARACLARVKAEAKKQVAAIREDQRRGG